MQCSVCVDVRTLRAAGHDQGLDLAGDVRERPASTLDQQTRFVIIDRHPTGLTDHGAQIVGTEQRHRLPRIEDEGNAVGGELRGVLAHAEVAFGRDDTETNAGGLRHLVDVSVIHRPRMEGRDLIVVGVGGDIRLRGVFVLELTDVIERQTVVEHPGAVGTEIHPDRRHHLAVAPEQLEIVGNVARAAAEIAAQSGHQEGHVQHVDAIRKDMIFEVPLEHHHRVVGHRTAD